MIFINKAGRIVYANERCEKLMGYDREQLCSADFDFLTLVAEEHRESTVANFRTHMGGLEVPPFEYTIVTRDGTRIEAILTTKLIQYEGERAVLGIVTDITQHKEAERGLKRSETKLRTLIENAPIGIYVNESAGISSSWTSSVRKMLRKQRYFWVSVERANTPDLMSLY
ncbi:MAG: PAS domain-containing protein, partial [Planctomycetota bacterium]|jgi:PAS domain S-box-containing protein